MRPVSVAFGLTACTDPNNPGQRAVRGGLIGGAAGAGIGALAGGGKGALIGGVAGTVVGAGTGYLTTPQRPANGN
jgi:YMGG-like Gly-zipper